MIPNFNKTSKQILGSPLLLPAYGRVGQGQHFFFLRRILRSKIQIPSASKARARRKGGVGGFASWRTASPEPKAKPQRPCSFRAEPSKKVFFFLLPARRSLGAGGEEKIGRAQIKKCEENFFAAAGRSVSFAQRNFAQSLEYPT